MTRRYQTKKTDNNEKDIVSALRQIPGVSVETGHDDILLGYKNKTYWFEIKNPSEVDKNGKPYAKKSETAKKQKKLDDEFKGHYKIVYCIEQILAEIGIQQIFRFGESTTEIEGDAFKR